MGDAYTELLVKCNMTLGMRVLKILMIAVAALVTVLTVLTMNVLIFALALLSYFGCYIVNKKSNIEYEYILVNDMLDVDKIFNRMSRKRMATIDASTIEVMAPLGSHALDSYQQLKVVDYSANDPAQKPYVVVCKIENEMKRVVLQLDQKMVRLYKMRMPRKVIEY